MAFFGAPELTLLPISVRRVCSRFLQVTHSLVQASTIVIPNPTVDEICRKVEASVLRVASITDLRCTQEDRKVTLHGKAPSREESVLAVVAARLVPGVETVASDLKISR